MQKKIISDDIRNIVCVKEIFCLESIYTYISYKQYNISHV